VCVVAQVSQNSTESRWAWAFRWPGEMYWLLLLSGILRRTNGLDLFTLREFRTNELFAVTLVRLKSEKAWARLDGIISHENVFVA
jgi:hypothetical protein